MESVLSIRTTVVDAYRFVLHHQGRLARMALPWMVAALALATLPPRAGLGPAELWTGLGGLVDLLGVSAVGAAFVRRLRRGDPWPPLAAPLDGTALRYLAGGLLVGVLVGLAAVALGFVFMLVASLLRLLAPAAAGLVALPVVLLLVGTLLAVYGRLAPLPVVAVLGGGFSPTAVWRRTRGHTLRILLIQLGVLVPLLAAGVAAAALFAGLAGAEEPVLPSEGGPLTPVGILADLALRSVGYAEAALTGTALAAVELRLPTAPPPGSPAPR